MCLDSFNRLSRSSTCNYWDISFSFSPFFQLVGILELHQPSWTTGDLGNEEATETDTEMYLPATSSMNAARSDGSR